MLDVGKCKSGICNNIIAICIDDELGHCNWFGVGFEVKVKIKVPILSMMPLVGPIQLQALLSSSVRADTFNNL